MLRNANPENIALGVHNPLYCHDLLMVCRITDQNHSFIFVAVNRQPEIVAQIAGFDVFKQRLRQQMSRVILHVGYVVIRLQRPSNIVRFDTEIFHQDPGDGSVV